MARIPSELTLLLVAGALLVVYSDMVNGDVSLPTVSFQKVGYGAKWRVAPGVKTYSFTFWVNATTWSAPKDSLQDLTGTGLWNLSLSARHSKDPFGAPEKVQILSLEQSSMPLSGGKLNTEGVAVLSGVGGCPEDKAYICFILDKGNDSDPEFKLASPIRGCLNKLEGLGCEE